MFEPMLESPVVDDFNRRVQTSFVNKALIYNVLIRHHPTMPDVDRHRIGGLPLRQRPEFSSFKTGSWMKLWLTTAGG